MKSIQKYLKRKAADGTVYKIAATTFVLFNFAYFASLLVLQLKDGKKIDFDFFKDLTDPRTCFYITVLSIISAVLAASFIFYKIKTKRLNCRDNWDFDGKVIDLLSDDAKKDTIEKITINLDHNGLMIMPNENVIEIPVLHYDMADQELKETNKPFEGITFIKPSFWSNKNKSIYPEVVGSEKVLDTIKEINRSNIFLFKKTDFEKYYNKGYSGNVRYQHDTIYISNREIQKSADKIFKFTDLYNISSIKLHYADYSSTEVKLKEEQPADMELYEYINASRPHPLDNIKEPQIAFVPAIAGNRPIFDGKVL